MSIDANMRRGLVLLLLIGALLYASALRVAASAATAADAALRFVNSNNEPIANDVVWVFCYADEQATIFVKALLVQTDVNGNPVTPLPVSCPWITALHREYEHPSGKVEHGPAYRLYAASWRTGSGTPDFDSAGCSYGVTGCAVARPSNGDVVIRKEWPLILFNLVASLEWQPEKGSQYAKQLRAGLKAASLYLADLTDGYMAIGPVAIYTNGRNWNGADLRFHTANDLRPAAFIGGITDSSHLYTAPATGLAAIVRPAATFYGRYWDGDDAHTGTWNLPDALRSLVHEWAHYALFLYDEYGFEEGRLGTTPSYCLCNDLPDLLNPSVATVCGTVTRENGPSAMAFHYTASELWHPIDGSPPNCAKSDQGHFHGESDWTTLEEWYKLQNLGLPALGVPSAPVAGPTTPPLTGPAADAFGRSDNFVLTLPFLTAPGIHLPSTAVYTSTLHVQVASIPSPIETLVPQVYLLQTDTSGKDRHILYQGTLTGEPSATSVGEIDLWGITDDDALHLFMDRYETVSTEGGRFIYTSSPSENVETLDVVTAAPNFWGSSLDLVYSTTVASGDVPGLLGGVMVVLSGNLNLSLLSPPRAQICVPDAKIGCPAAWNKVMQLTSANKWAAVFTPLPGAEELPLYGVVRIISPQRRFDGLIRWFGDAGGVGPGHKIGNAAPLRDGLVMVDHIDEPPLETECNRVMVMPAANYPALNVPLAAEALVSPPLDLDILLGDAVNGQCFSTGLAGSEEFKPLRLTLFYSEETVRRLGIRDESELFILQFAPSLEEWIILASTVDPNLNRVTTRIVQDGIYAIGWSP